MTDLEKTKDWISAYPGYQDLKNFQCDFVDQAVPGGAGIFPSGLVEIARTEDVLGNVEIQNQYNFALYCVFEKPANDDIAASYNAGWVMDFQRWVQSQSALGLAPKFGDDPETERIMAQNGVLFDANEDGTVGVYMVQISALFTVIPNP